MSTVNKQGLPMQVVDQLGARIMAGELAPGATVDPVAVAEEFGVSRTVVREALRVLTAKGLLGARPKFGTYVTDRADWQLLDAGVMAWRTADQPDPRLVLELDEVRLAIEPAAARMAAHRRSDAQLQRIQDAYTMLDQSYRGTSSPGPDHVQADLQFHRAVLAASGNELLERFEMLLAPALQARDRLAHQHMTTLDFLDGHKGVLDAIAERDSTRAAERMFELMRLSARDSADALGIELPPQLHG